MHLHSELYNALVALDREKLKAEFTSQNEFLVVEHFLPVSMLEALIAFLPSLDSRVHRNYIPAYKKGGSVSRFDLDALAPAFGQLYHAPEWRAWLNEFTGTDLSFCPAADPHTYALYYYTEPGDHVGWHYDTSYYQGNRYTVLLGLVDQSTCRLECELYRGDERRTSERRALALKPGTLVLFNGDKLYHRITPLGEGERRIALTMEYLTDSRIMPLRRFVSNMKDAIAYFGFKTVFGWDTA
jgi:alkylated DNA repair dioxygenase AlkB